MAETRLSYNQFVYSNEQHESFAIVDIRYLPTSYAGMYWLAKAIHRKIDCKKYGVKILGEDRESLHINSLYTAIKLIRSVPGKCATDEIAAYRQRLEKELAATLKQRTAAKLFQQAQNMKKHESDISNQKINKEIFFLKTQARKTKQYVPQPLLRIWAEQGVGVKGLLFRAQQAERKTDPSSHRVRQLLHVRKGSDPTADREREPEIVEKVTKRNTGAAA